MTRSSESPSEIKSDEPLIPVLSYHALDKVSTPVEIPLIIPAISDFGSSADLIGEFQYVNSLDLA